MAAADFYLLEAVGNRALYTYTTPTMEMLSPEQENEMFEMLGVKGRTSRELILKDMKSQLKTLRSEDKTYALRDIENKALAFQAELVDILDRSFVPYVHIAIGGEIRHHRAMGDHLSNDRNEAWSDWRTIFDTIGNDSLLDVEQLFLEFGEDNTYGGPNWAAVTKILWLRHQEMLGPDLYTNKKLFVDRVFSLQHNGGSLFDKITWSVKNMRGWGVGKLSHLLDYHSAEIPNIVGLLRLASPKVRALLLEYVEAAQGVEPTHERFKTDTLSRELAISPILQCQDCKMDIARGHVLECGNFLKPNAPLEYTLGRNMKTLWQDDISAKELAFISSPMIVPFDAWGNPQIEPTQEFIVEIEGTITEYGGKVVETFYSRKHTALEIFEGITFATLPSATDIIVAHNGDRSNLPCISTTHLRICITQEDIKSPLYYRQTYTRAPIKSGPNGEVILLATTFNAAVKRPYK